MIIEKHYFFSVKHNKKGDRAAGAPRYKEETDNYYNY